MTAQGENILAFLDSAITEAADSADRWHDRECDVHAIGLTDFADQLMAAEVPGAVCDCDGPASVLRRCGADRKVIELYRSYMAEPQQSHYADGGNRAMQQERSLPALRALRPVIQLLAEGYGWTEGEL